MNQLALSTDLTVITAEINSFKQVAGQAMFEIGKRLKHVRDNDLVHGEWKLFLDSIDISKSQADRFIKVFTEYDNGKLPHVGNIGFRALYEIATLPPEERDKPHLLSSGETKLPNEMTVRELEEVKKELQASELRARNAEAARQQAITQHSEQQEKLLAQIDDLKKKKAPSAADKEELRKLTEENGALTQAIRKMQDDHLEQFSALESKQHDLRKMKEALSKTRAYVDVDLSVALMHFGPISDQRAALETAEHFWKELDETIANMRAKWLVAMNNQIEEVGVNAERVVVIDG